MEHEIKNGIITGTALRRSQDASCGVELQSFDVVEVPGAIGGEGSAFRVITGWGFQQLAWGLANGGEHEIILK